jgi:hypothetical protein
MLLIIFILIVAALLIYGIWEGDSDMILFAASVVLLCTSLSWLWTVTAFSIKYGVEKNQNTSVTQTIKTTQILPYDVELPYKETMKYTRLQERQQPSVFCLIIEHYKPQPLLNFIIWPCHIESSSSEKWVVMSNTVK